MTGFGTSFLLYIPNMAFSKEYLKDYERKIRELPVEELYDILSQIRDHAFQADDSPERIRIVEKRIIELTGDKNAILPLPQYTQSLNEKYQNRMTPGSIVFKVIGITLIFAGFCFIDNHLKQYTSFNFIISGLGFLTFVIGCTFDGQIRLCLKEFTVIRTRQDHPKEFKRITGILDIIGFGLIIYGLFAF